MRTYEFNLNKRVFYIKTFQHGNLVDQIYVGAETTAHRSNELVYWFELVLTYDGSVFFNTDFQGKLVNITQYTGRYKIK